MLGEVDCTPTAGNLREKWSVRVRDTSSTKYGAGVEAVTAFGAQLEVLLLVEADAEHVEIAVLERAVTGFCTEMIT